MHPLGLLSAPAALDSARDTRWHEYGSEWVLALEPRCVPVCIGWIRRHKDYNYV